MITRAEVYKTFRTRSTWVVAAVAAGGMVLLHGVMLVIGHLLPNLEQMVADSAPAEFEAQAADDFAEVSGLLDVSSIDYQAGLLDLTGTALSGSTAGISTICAMIAGVLIATTDFRHGGIIPAVLTAPRRWPLGAAKAIAAVGVAGLIAALGVLFGLVSFGVHLLSFEGMQVAVSVTDIASVWVRGLLALSFYALLGLGVGLLTRSMVGGIILVLSAMLIEPFIGFIMNLPFMPEAVQTLSNYLPLSLGAAAVGGSQLDLMASNSFGPWVALSVVALWAAITWIGGTIRLAKQDIAA